MSTADIRYLKTNFWSKHNRKIAIYKDITITEKRQLEKTTFAVFSLVTKLILILPARLQEKKKQTKTVTDWSVRFGCL